MAEPKTKPTQVSVKEFLNQIPDKERREDCFTVVKIMEEITGDTEDVGTEHRRLRHLPVQIRERT